MKHIASQMAWMTVRAYNKCILAMDRLNYNNESHKDTSNLH